MNIRTHSHRFVIAALLLALAGCGGGDESAPVTPPASSPPPPPLPTPPGTVIGVAGGTVTDLRARAWSYPAGALTTDTRIHIEQSSAGAPPLPPGVPSGQMFAFTPHGTTFAVPVTITMPFEPATVPTGNVPVFYKTNAQGQFAALTGVEFGADSASARVTGFSVAQIIIEPLTPDQLLRKVIFNPTEGNSEAVSDDEGELDERRFVGPAGLFEIPFDGDNTSALEAYSSADAVPFWVASESGKGQVRLDLDRSFIKEVDNATLDIVITRALVEAVDFNGAPTESECPQSNRCDLLAGFASFETELTRATAEGEDFVYLADEEFPELDGDVPVLDMGGILQLLGYMGDWIPTFDKEWGRTTSPFNGQNVETTHDVDDDPAQSHPRVQTRGQIVIPVDLSRVKRFERFWINTTMRAITNNRRGGESGIGAFLRDPLKVGGAAMQFTGLRPSGAPRPTPRVPRRPIACAAGIPDPLAGELQFSAVNYQILEGRSEHENQDIMITRSNGSRGAVSAPSRSRRDRGFRADYTSRRHTVRLRGW